MRLKSLRAAGIADCFDALVLSSAFGVRKPDPRFYAAVTQAAGRPPEDILFVRDDPETDALDPHAYGMSAVLVTSLPTPRLPTRSRIAPARPSCPRGSPRSAVSGS
ncbi:HAD family hydrolase [Streptomyces violascens]|uniref:HAD family hydrolase n=1 Tax=Streptomyces violascens TaxID=67381 RepID=UPI0036C594CF